MSESPGSYFSLQLLPGQTFGGNTFSITWNRGLRFSSISKVDRFSSYSILLAGITNHPSGTDACGSTINTATALQVNSSRRKSSISRCWGTAGWYIFSRCFILETMCLFQYVGIFFLCKDKNIWCLNLQFSSSLKYGIVLGWLSSSYFCLTVYSLLVCCNVTVLESISSFWGFQDVRLSITAHDQIILINYPEFCPIFFCSS